MRRTTRALDNQTEGLERLQPGTTLQDRYLILGVLGSGGMSSVYKGRDLHFPNVTKLVAIKEMTSMLTDQTMYEMVVTNFEREADLLATLSHPSIPRIYDYYTDKNSLYLVMEFIDGKDLEAILHETDDFLPVEQVINWAVDLCDVLSYLHNHKPEPLVFRDMKPSNVMVDQHDQIRLIDFGIARVFQPGTKGTMIGTEGYSPPEQYRGEASPAGDIYALGATLHHLLTRRDPRIEPPFSFSERPIREINPNVSPEFEAIINTSLDYDPKKRYSTTETLKQALLAAVKETGILIRPRTAEISAHEDDVKELWSFECEDEIRGSPILYQDVIYIGCYDNNLYALDAQTGEFLWKYATDGGITGRPAAEDGVIFIGSEDHRLHAITARGGKLVWTYYTEGPIRSSPTLSHGHIFFGSDDAYLHVVNSLNGRRVWRAEANAPIWSTPLIQEERVYFGCESGDFYCYDFRGEMKWRKKVKRAVTSSPIIFDGLIYFGSKDWTLYALEVENGWQVWRFRMGGPTISTPSTSEDKIFIGCGDNNIYAVHARHAREVWRFSTEHQVTGSPTVFEDSLYCGSVDGYLYCLDIRSGRLRWRFRTEGPITGSPAMAEDRLFIGSNDHKVYALLA
ncbi:MAG: protein kinase [Anaerolineae bacterium SM23_ 63]|nr:MAG: protein kinase [Anaerolineae bacterium SM23_ 63]HEY45739.1 serine/threonine-protein kinase [Anaerolineae bacterium]